MRRHAFLLLLLSVLAGSAHAEDTKARRFVVFFQEWSAALDEPAQAVITQAADFAKANPRAPVRVHGYADPTGSREANILMSELRAQRVADQLRDAGIAPARIRQDGHGSVKFAITSLESRRVEVEIPGR
jgi:outer membrane protein OmpA-like peptidoglycan-associated protein